MPASNRRVALWAIVAPVILFGSVVFAGAQSTSVSDPTPLLLDCDSELIDVTTVIDGRTVTRKEFRNPCGIDDFLNQFVILSQWGQSLVIVLGTGMLIYGGFSWITAGGRPSKIEEGKRVILGTLVGITVSFTAYIIINFTVGAISGTSVASPFNPFAGPISTIFGTQPFSGNLGSGGAGGEETCRQRWDNNCSNQIYCADPGTAPGEVVAIQDRLDLKGCSPGPEDGCFGTATARAVRRFQVVNEILPTGMVDEATRTALFGNGRDCGWPGLGTGGESTVIDNTLNPPSVERARGQPTNVTGCCVFLEDDEVTSNAMFCANNVSQRVCVANGANNIFVEDQNCYLSDVTNDLCGFCHAYEGRCWGGTARAWCETKISPPIAFVIGPGEGLALCKDAAGNVQYTEALRTQKP